MHALTPMAVAVTRNCETGRQMLRVHYNPEGCPEESELCSVFINFE